MERGAPARFTLQLILDKGVDESIVQPEAEDMEPLLMPFESTPHPMFDKNRKVLIFGSIKA
jgi:hypothetical protein